MKTRIQNIGKAFLLLNLFLISTVCLAQANEGFTYQAVIRNSSGALVANTTVGIRISLLQNTATGPVLFSERHTPTTNANGLVTFVITNGTLISGNYSSIDWSNIVVFLKTDTDPTGGTNYTITGTSQFKSVPFANYANDVGNAWKPNGNAVGSTDFIGSVNDADVRFIRNGNIAGRIGNTNTAFGRSSLPNNNSVSNSAFGAFSLGQNTAGFGNVGFGYEALRINNGNYNTAIGNGTLALATADQNTAIGWRSLDLLTTGGGNIAIGKITNVPSPTTNNQLSIGNVIYGTNMGDTATGTIGIGVPVPTEKLEVAGKTKTTNLQVTNGAGVNRVLTSDASGNATWQNSNVNTGVNVGKSTVQNIASNVVTKLIYESELTDDSNAYNNSNGNWTIPSTGFYHIYATIEIFPSAPLGTRFEIQIRRNGIAPKSQGYYVETVNMVHTINISADMMLTQNDIITIHLIQNSSSTVQTSNGPWSSYFSGYKIY